MCHFPYILTLYRTWTVATLFIKKHYFFKNRDASQCDESAKPILKNITIMKLINILNIWSPGKYENNKNIGIVNIKSSHPNDFNASSIVFIDNTSICILLYNPLLSFYILNSFMKKHLHIT